MGPAGGYLYFQVQFGGFRSEWDQEVGVGAGSTWDQGVKQEQGVKNSEQHR